MSTLWLVLRAAVLLALLPVALRVVSVSRLVALLTPRRRLTVRRGDDLTIVRALVDRLVDRRPFRVYGHCLRRSLVLYDVATRAGYPVRIALGIRRTDDGITGHGWLELDGCPFLERGENPETHFEVMERLPRLAPQAAGQ